MASHRAPDRIISPVRQAISKLRTPLTEGERAVFDLLHEKLPAQWEIYVQPHLNGCRPDFVLLNPSIGIGVLEVKDWTLDGMRWQTSGLGDRVLAGTCHGRRFRQADPTATLLHYKREIFDLYCPRLRKKAGLAAIGAGLIFPNADEPRAREMFGNSLPSKYEFISSRDAIEARDIARIFPPALRRSSQLMTPELADDLRSWLIEPDHAAEQREPLRLDANQREFASTRTSTGYRRIRGPAGSGKSAVLAARASQLCQGGLRVLVVTFNITLLHYLRDLCSRARMGHPNEITWINFHALCKRLAMSLGVERAYKSIWKDHYEQGFDAFSDVPDMLLRALSSNEHADIDMYDAVFVDEGQDFDPKWWQLLRKLCKPQGEMVLFTDATQDVYGTARRWTDDAMSGAGFVGRWSELLVSYRLPRPLLELSAQYARLFLPSEGRLEPRSPQGELNVEPCHLRWIQTDATLASHACVTELLRLIEMDEKVSLSMSDLTLLVDKIEDGLEVVDALNRMNIKTAETFVRRDGARSDVIQEDRRKKLSFWKGRPRVKVTTLHSYKGWEGRTLVLSLTRATGERTRAAIYAGLTRLKRHPAGSYLTVVCSDESLREFGEQWPYFESSVSRLA
jgi:AAA domain/Nuclease-related domain